MEHGVHAEALAAVEAGVGPLVVGVVLVLRKPADAAGVGFVVRPGVAAEAGEVFVAAAAVGDVEAVAFKEARGLHLADAAVSGVGAKRCSRTAGVGALMSTERNMSMPRVGVDADDAGGVLAELALDGEAVLNLIGDLGVGLELRECGGWAARVTQWVMGTQPDGGQRGRVEREHRRSGGARFGSGQDRAAELAPKRS